MFDRRAFVIAASALAAAPALAKDNKMEELYGLIGQMTCAPGKRAKMIAILAEGTATMPGCRSYIVAEDATDMDAIWITEVWESKAAHAASLTLPAVQAAIARARPIITGFGHRFETVPRAGV
jgi:quinol monooxygenase YgiN